MDEEGDIVVTELHAKYNPFIRYCVGDRGILSHDRCTCGRELPVLTILSGRTDGYVITADGRKIYDAIFAYTLKNGIKQFKAIQNNINSIDIYVVIDNKYNYHVENSYKTELHKIFGESMAINIFKVDSIPKDKSGKLRYFERRFNL